MADEQKVEDGPKRSDITDEHRKFLNKLRRSGRTNMWGAPAYVCAHFSVDKAEANRIVGVWMDTYDPKLDD